MKARIVELPSSFEITLTAEDEQDSRALARFGLNASAKLKRNYIWVTFPSVPASPTNANLVFSKLRDSDGAPSNNSSLSS